MPGSARAQDSLRVHTEFGLVTDYTNQIYYEQTFDSTVVTGRVMAQDARARLVAEAVNRLFGADGRWSFDVSNVFGGGPTVLRDAAHGSITRSFAPLVRARLDGEFDARRDDTYGARRQDRRAAGSGAMLWSSRDGASAARLFGRLEGLRSAEGTLALYPDYDYRQVGIDVDRFGSAGHAGLQYAYGTRAFPDTSARDYREHTLSLDGRWRVSDPVRLEGTGFAARRLAWRDSAVGDRFFSTDTQLALLVARGERFEWGGLGRVRGQQYDDPTPTFFNAWIWRYGLIARAIPGPLDRYELRPEVEFARTPHFGGVPSTTSPDDLAAVAGEEYDQFSLTAEAERLGLKAWWWGSLAGGRRHYLVGETDPTDVSGRTSFWYAEFSGYADRRITGPLRVRASGGARFEFHDTAADDLTSLDFALDLRLPLP